MPEPLEVRGDNGDVKWILPAKCGQWRIARLSATRRLIWCRVFAAWWEREGRRLASNPWMWMYGNHTLN